jgi:hypothetical protein
VRSPSNSASGLASSSNGSNKPSAISSPMEASSVVGKCRASS